MFPNLSCDIYVIIRCRKYLDAFVVILLWKIVLKYIYLIWISYTWQLATSYGVLLSMYRKGYFKYQENKTSSQKAMEWKRKRSCSHRFLIMGKLPGKKEILACFESENDLHNRSWKNVKDFCRNLIETKKRRGLLT